MVKKIIVITVEAYNDKSSKKNAEDFFIKNGWDFEYWCISECATYSDKSHLLSNKVTKDNVKYFSDTSRVISEIEALPSKSYFIYHFQINHRTESLIKSILSKSIKTIRIDMNDSLSKFGYVFDKWSNRLKYIKKPSLIYTKIRDSKAIKRLQDTPGFNQIKTFRTGQKYSGDYSITFDDVYSYEKVKNQEWETPYKDYILFADIALPNHIDFTNLNISTIDKDIYFKKINSFFDKIEQETGLPVIIAAHPKSRKHKDYGTRPFIFGKTDQLIANSNLVLMHYSSTMSYCALAKKPLVFLTTNEFYKKNTFLHSILKRIQIQSKYLNTQYINIDDFSKFTIPDPDNDRYKQFINDFLLSSHFPKKNENIILEYLTSPNE